MPESVTRRIKCDEPQTIYELMQKNGLRCSTVWNSAISLSAKSPCTALTDHKMNIVSVNSIPESNQSSFAPCTSQISTFYHNMKYIKIHAKRKALRYMPYEREDAPFPMREREEENDDDDDDEQEEDAPIPVAIYYEEPVALLRDVIAADGRFLESCLDSRSGSCVTEVERDNDIVLSGIASISRNGYTTDICVKL